MEFSTDLPATPAAPGLARAAVRDFLRGTAAPGLVDDAVLVTSELVTNALRYGAEPMSLHLTVERDSLVIAVKDGNPSVLPYPKILTQTEPTGRGMHLISAASCRWGWDRNVNSKIVWAELQMTGNLCAAGTS
jgi:anti-sigma regulatory factor (Ser/Thr protein kinase)